MKIYDIERLVRYTRKPAEPFSNLLLAVRDPRVHDRVVDEPEDFSLLNHERKPLLGDKRSLPLARDDITRAALLLRGSRRLGLREVEPLPRLDVGAHAPDAGDAGGERIRGDPRVRYGG